MARGIREASIERRWVASNQSGLDVEITHLAFIMIFDVFREEKVKASPSFTISIP
jgi:hypothetical protein